MVHVLGAGVLGMGAALALLERGHDVTLSDPRGIGQATSARGAGIVSTFTWNAVDAKLIQETRGRIGELVGILGGVQPTFRSTWNSHDSLFIAKDGPEVRAVRKRCEDITEEVETLEPGQARSLYPEFDFADDEVVLVAQEDGYVEGTALCQLVEAYALELGLERTQAAPKDADGLVVACGPWTRSVVQQMGGDLAVANFRTQAATIQGWTAPIFHDHVTGFYGRPDGEAQLVGNGTILEPVDAEDDHEASLPGFEESMARKLDARIRSGSNVHFRRSWSGLCVGTPDRRPMVGAVPELDDVYVLTGDNGFGIMRSLALGERLADAVAGDGNPQFDPARADPKEPFPLREGYGDLSET